MRLCYLSRGHALYIYCLYFIVHSLLYIVYVYILLYIIIYDLCIVLLYIMGFVLFLFQI